MVVAEIGSDDNRSPRVVSRKEWIAEASKHNLEIRKRILRQGFTAVPACLLRDGSVSSNAKILFLALLSRIREGGPGKCFLLERTLSGMTSIPLRSLQKAKAELKEGGWLDWTYRPNSMPRRCVYRLNIPDRIDEGGESADCQNREDF